MAAADGGFNRDTIAHRQGFDAGPYGGDLPSRLVTQDRGVARRRARAILLQVVVHIAAADAAGAQAHDDFARSRVRGIGDRAEFYFVWSD
jgi:hypothetical protein